LPENRSRQPVAILYPSLVFLLQFGLTSEMEERREVGVRGGDRRVIEGRVPSSGYSFVGSLVGVSDK
jgi:hypothetical protein